MNSTNLPSRNKIIQFLLSVVKKRRGREKNPKKFVSCENGKPLESFYFKLLNQ